jgi:hypothetical protein
MNNSVNKKGDCKLELFCLIFNISVLRSTFPKLLTCNYHQLLCKQLNHNIFLFLEYDISRCTGDTHYTFTPNTTE